ncbi:MAG: transposase [Rubrivivax sp.]
MARLPRISLPGHAHHVVQRGHNRQCIVHDDTDRQQWKSLLHDAAVTHRVDVHAWLLLDDHFHLVLTPHAAEGLGRMMQSLARRHAAEFNRRHARTGTLWEGRYRCAMVQPGPWLADCMVYVESHPARHPPCAAGLAWPWSSLGHHLGAQRDPLVVEPAVWWSLGNTPFEREAAWRTRVEAGLSPDRVQRITLATRRGWPVAEEAFARSLEPGLGRPVTPRPRGRPPLAGPVGSPEDNAQVS